MDTSTQTRADRMGELAIALNNVHEALTVDGLIAAIQLAGITIDDIIPETTLIQDSIVMTECYLARTLKSALDNNPLHRVLSSGSKSYLNELRWNMINQQYALQNDIVACDWLPKTHTLAQTVVNRVHIHMTTESLNAALGKNMDISVPGWKFTGYLAGYRQGVNYVDLFYSMPDLKKNLR